MAERVVAWVRAGRSRRGAAGRHRGCGRSGVCAAHGPRGVKDRAPPGRPLSAAHSETCPQGLVNVAHNAATLAAARRTHWGFRMSRPTVRFVAATIGVLVAASTAGCQSGAPEPHAASPSVSVIQPTAEPSPRPSRVVVAPERPATMGDDGAAGAAATAKYFIELDSYMQATGDTAEWETLSHPACEYCSTRLAQARTIVANDDAYDGGHANVEVLQIYEQDPATGVWPVDVRVHEGATTITRSDGGVAFSHDEYVYTATVGVGRRDGEWVVTELGNGKVK